jgi:hypothetical protein
MAGKYIYFFVLLLLFGVIPSHGQESATITATASVANPIGLKSNVSQLPLSAKNESIVIRRPGHGSLICCIETDNEVIDHFTLSSCEKVSENRSEIYYQINNIDFTGDTLIITLIYSENR